MYSRGALKQRFLPKGYTLSYGNRPMETEFNKKDFSSVADVIIKTTKDNIWRELDGEAVILNTKSGIFCGLNEVGMRIWQIVQELTYVRNIRDTLLGEYNVERHRCESELLALLQKMLDHGLIEIADEKTNN